MAIQISTKRHGDENLTGIKHRKRQSQLSWIYLLNNIRFHYPSWGYLAIFLVDVCVYAFPFY